MQARTLRKKNRSRCRRLQNGNYFLPDDDKAMLYVYRIE